MILALRDAVRSTLAWLNDAPRKRLAFRATSAVMGGAILFRAVTEVPYAEYLWGPHGLGQGTRLLGIAATDRLVSSLFSHSGCATALLVVLGLCGFSLVMGWQTRIAAAGALICGALFEARLGELTDGGDNILRLALMFMVFCISPHVPDTRLRKGALVNWLHNLGLTALVGQLCVIYFCTGFSKISGEAWRNGTALYQISQVEWFSLPWMRHLFLTPFVTTVACYITMMYQIWFPIAIFSRAKIPFVFFGVFLHVGIFYFMGLISFSLVMLGMELVVLSDEEIGIAVRIVSSMAERIFDFGRNVVQTTWGSH